MDQFEKYIKESKVMKDLPRVDGTYGGKGDYFVIHEENDLKFAVKLSLHLAAKPRFYVRVRIVSGVDIMDVGAKVTEIYGNLSEKLEGKGWEGTIGQSVQIDPARVSFCVMSDKHVQMYGKIGDPTDFDNLIENYLSDMAKLGLTVHKVLSEYVRFKKGTDKKISDLVREYATMIKPKAPEGYAKEKHGQKGNEEKANDQVVSIIKNAQKSVKKEDLKPKNKHHPVDDALQAADDAAKKPLVTVVVTPKKPKK